MSDTLPLGTETAWGRVQAIGMTGGERYYWMVDRAGDVSMMPAFVVEPRPDGGPDIVKVQERERVNR